jgi:hypothetical protein
LKPPAALSKIPRSLKILILIVLGVKLLTFTLGYATAYLSQGPAPPFTILMNQFYQWDSLHYMDIAKNWYVSQGDQLINIVFFPLYPLLIRLATTDPVYTNFWALLISNLSSVIACLYLYKIAKLDYDDNAAVKAVLFMVVFPTSFFLSMMYTEGLFLALVIASFYYARTGKWWAAGPLALLATLTRLAGLVLIPALMAEYLHQKKWNPRKIDLNMAWVFLAGGGFLIYLGLNNHVTGNPLAFMEIERIHWFQSFDPIRGLQTAVRTTFNGAIFDALLAVAQIIFACIGLVAVIAGVRFRLRPSYIAYMASSWMLIVSTGFWASIPRYVLTMFPMFILLGFAVPSKKIQYAIAAASLAVMCAFTVIFTLGKFAF